MDQGSNQRRGLRPRYISGNRRSCRKLIRTSARQIRATRKQLIRLIAGTKPQWSGVTNESTNVQLLRTGALILSEIVSLNFEDLSVI